MKKILPFLCSIWLVACSDGDLQIETLDFDDVSVDDCGDLTTTGTNILFKIDGDEALILELENNAFSNGNSATDSVVFASAIPSRSSLTYRLFTENVTNSYFCGDIPPASPTVSQEIVAESGVVTIKTIAVNDSTQFSHTITLDSIILIDASGNRITDLTVSEFGTVATTIAN